MLQRRYVFAGHKPFSKALRRDQSNMPSLMPQSSPPSNPVLGFRVSGHTLMQLVVSGTPTIEQRDYIILSVCSQISQSSPRMFS